MTRQVQKHFQPEADNNIPSNYLIAYSNLFGCSIDYLVGKTEVQSVDLEVRDISLKTGLTEQAILNLINSKETYCILDNFSPNKWWSQ